METVEKRGGGGGGSKKECQKKKGVERETNERGRLEEAGVYVLIGEGETGKRE